MSHGLISRFSVNPIVALNGKPVNRLSPAPRSVSALIVRTFQPLSRHREISTLRARATAYWKAEFGERKSPYAEGRDRSVIGFNCKSCGFHCPKDAPVGLARKQRWRAWPCRDGAQTSSRRSSLQESDEGQAPVKPPSELRLFNPQLGEDVLALGVCLISQIATCHPYFNMLIIPRSNW